MPNSFREKKVFIASHYEVPGVAHALYRYLYKHRIGQVTLLLHPLGQNGHSTIQTFVSGQTTRKRSIWPAPKNFLVRSVWDMTVTFFSLVFTWQRTDLYIGIDSFNAFAGLMAKKCGAVRQVVFHTIDYVPKRFPGKHLNNLYHWFDKYCLSHATETWNVSPRIAEGREKIRGLSRKKYHRQKVVPMGVWLGDVKRVPANKVKYNQLLFLGSLLEKQGVQVVLRAIPEVVKQLPEFHFLIVGGGEYEAELKKITDDLEIAKHVTFTGRVNSRKEFERLISDSAVAIAPYDKKKDTFTYYADPGKIKEYLATGTPVILTDVPYNARELERNGCGFIVSYSVEAIAAKLMEVMGDDTRLQESRKNALNYVKSCNWEVIFSKALTSLRLSDNKT